MARRLEGDETKDLVNRTELSLYPWDEWTDGSVWEIVRGVDFDCDAETMRGQIKVRQRKAGLYAKTSVHRSDDGKDRVVFQFMHKKPGEKGQRRSR